MIDMTPVKEDQEIIENFQSTELCKQVRQILTFFFLNRGCMYSMIINMLSKLMCLTLEAHSFLPSFFNIIGLQGCIFYRKTSSPWGGRLLIKGGGMQHITWTLTITFFFHNFSLLVFFSPNFFLKY